MIVQWVRSQIFSQVWKKVDVEKQKFELLMNREWVFFLYIIRATKKSLQKDDRKKSVSSTCITLEIKLFWLGSRIRDLEAFWCKAEIKSIYFVSFCLIVLIASECMVYSDLIKTFILQIAIPNKYLILRLRESLSELFRL